MDHPVATEPWLLFVCMWCMHACADASAHVGTCGSQMQTLGQLSSIAPPPHLSKQSLTEPGAHHFGWTYCPVTPRLRLSPPSRYSGAIGTWYHTWILSGLWKSRLWFLCPHSNALRSRISSPRFYIWQILVVRGFIETFPYACIMYLNIVTFLSLLI